jgi:hypothetical protein
LIVKRCTKGDQIVNELVMAILRGNVKWRQEKLRKKPFINKKRNRKKGKETSGHEEEEHDGNVKELGRWNDLVAEENRLLGCCRRRMQQEEALRCSITLRLGSKMSRVKIAFAANKFNVLSTFCLGGKFFCNER